MSHHVYTTRGLVLRLRPRAESDKLAAVLTRDLGLVFGTARGSRKPSSKLSGILLDLSLVKISLVRGKNSWRVTTVTLLRDFASELRGRRQALEAYSRVLALVGRLVHGEEKHPELFDELERSALILADEVGDEDVDAWELFSVAKALHHLGYLSKEALPSNIIETREKRRALLELVNQGIHSSGLYNV